MRFKLGWLCLGFFIFYNFQQLSWSIGSHLNTGGSIFYFIQGKAANYYPFYFLTWLTCTIICYSLFYTIFYRHQQKALAILSIIIIGIPLTVCARYFMEEVVLFIIRGKHNYGDHMRTPLRYFIDNVYYSLFYGSFGIVFFFIQLHNFQQKMQSELIIRSRQAELSFLRSQINPHFLFNSLNNVYTLVYQGSSKALESISKLSELLRYMLYEEEERVLLLKEVRYLQHYIDLQLMRYDFDPALNLNISLPADCMLKIAPLTLIPFVENAFKHGDLKDQNAPLTIILILEDQNMQFEVSNKIGFFNKDRIGGIGSENVKKRLELIYGSNHNLAISTLGKQYSIKLTINLHE